LSREERREKLGGLMERLGLGALLLRRPANFAWYTGGADNRVDHDTALGVAAILLTASGTEHVLTDNVEAPRMRGEVAPDVRVLEHPWYDGPGALVRELVGDEPLGADAPVRADERDVEAEISPLRYVLDAEALNAYRNLGADATAAMIEAATTLDPGTDEVEAAAILTAACRRRSMFAPVLLAASEERMAHYRHPIPRGGALGRRTMLVLCAERGGLYANLTRIVEFEEPDARTARRQRACDNILRRMREEATRPGRTLSAAFDDCRRFYAEEGYPDGWRDHHQGGLTGYASRELIATPRTRHVLRTNEAFAWNPSLVCAKAEQTFVLTDAGPHVLAPAEASAFS
jgi:Xaa-Pro dipeptidase